MVSHPDPDELTLAALPSEPADPAIEAHLAGCALCREHVAGLRRTVELAIEGAERAGDPASNGGPHRDPGERPPERVWQAIDAALAGERPPPSTPRPWARLALAAAAVLLAGFGIGFGVGYGTGAQRPAVVALATLSPLPATNPSATGTVEGQEIDGRMQITVRLSDVTAVDGADFLEVWLMDASTTKLVAVGSLARDGTTYTGSFTLPGGVPRDVYRMIDVSAERFDGNPAHSQVSLLRGQLS